MCQSIRYQINQTSFEEGGYCQFYHIKDNPQLGFKEFKSKQKALEAYNIQKKLSKFDLAPKVYNKVCKLHFYFDDLPNFDEDTNWGYITEVAEIASDKLFSFKKVQDLVDDIREKTGLKFWDCHWWNMGLIKRGRKKQLVCIDTGKETWDGLSNAWGNTEPGPKCCYCYKYQCKCSEY
jgi:hypothetical protein